MTSLDACAIDEDETLKVDGPTDQNGVMCAYIPRARLEAPSACGAVSTEVYRGSSKWKKIERGYKLGEPMRCRVIAANLVEGLAVATAIPEEVRTVSPPSTHKMRIQSALIDICQ